MDNLKKAAALAAVEYIRTGQIVGLGTGSTLAYAIRELGDRVQKGHLQIKGVPTSYQARLLAKECGIPIFDPMDVESVDITIDGADEVDPEGNLIKGAGAAHVMEKLVAAMSKQFIAVVDESKQVKFLGERFPVPVEVVSPALSFTMRALSEMGGKPVLRTGQGKVGPVISDLGHPIIDVHFSKITDPARLDRQINSLPGVVGHGLFVGMADLGIIALSPDNPRIVTLTFQRIIRFGRLMQDIPSGI